MQIQNHTSFLSHSTHTFGLGGIQETIYQLLCIPLRSIYLYFLLALFIYLLFSYLPSLSSPLANSFSLFSSSFLTSFMSSPSLLSSFSLLSCLHHFQLLSLLIASSVYLIFLLSTSSVSSFLPVLLFFSSFPFSPFLFPSQTFCSSSLSSRSQSPSSSLASVSSSAAAPLLSSPASS